MDLFLKRPNEVKDFYIEWKYKIKSTSLVDVVIIVVDRETQEDVTTDIEVSSAPIGSQTVHRLKNGVYGQVFDIHVLVKLSDDQELEDDVSLVIIDEVSVVFEKDLFEIRDFVCEWKNSLRTAAISTLSITVIDRITGESKTSEVVEHSLKVGTQTVHRFKDGIVGQILDVVVGIITSDAQVLENKFAVVIK